MTDSKLNPILVLRQMKRKKKTMTCTTLMKNTLVSLQPKGNCITRPEIGNLLVVAVTPTIYLPQILPSKEGFRSPSEFLQFRQNQFTSTHLLQFVYYCGNMTGVNLKLAFALQPHCCLDGRWNDYPSCK